MIAAWCDAFWLIIAEVVAEPDRGRPRNRLFGFV